MGDAFGEDVFYKVGEAIGNVGRRLLRRKRNREVEEVLRRWLKQVPVPTLQPARPAPLDQDDNVIEATYRVIDRGKESQND